MKSADAAKAILEQEFAAELKAHDLEPIEVAKDLSIISVVGDGMKQAKGIAARFFSALAQANISLVALHKVLLSVQFQQLSRKIKRLKP